MAVSCLLKHSRGSDRSVVRRLHYLCAEADLTLLAQCYWGTLAYQNVHDALFRRHHCLVTAGDKAAQLKVCGSQNAV